MKITKITIENFRSIKDAMSFDMLELEKRNCCILLGVNESGKSNILEAISLIDPSKKINYSLDCNNEVEEERGEILITYELKIENEAFYREQFIKKGIPEELANKIVITAIHRKVSIDFNNKRSDFFHIWIKDNKKEFEQYVIIDKDVVENGISKVKKIIDLKTSDNIQKDETGNVSNVLTKDLIENFIEEELFALFDANIPKVIFWKPEKEYLIDKPVDLVEFKNDLDISMPLRNCFRIAGIDDESIEDKIDSIIGNPAKISTLKDLLNREVTKHVNRVWREHKINIRFEIDNMQLSFLVEEKDNALPKYEVGQRSDGFKHFISILLNLSVENETNQLKNKIILLDEPEVHLHPSGEKYLRDELLRISENNIVFFATHSIYMVDKKNLDRHFSVKKEKGITLIFPIEKDNPYKEEVLYEALGSSVLEHIESNVLIFEGKTDKDIFDLYKRKFKKEIRYPNVSLISADGCGDIIKYTKFFNKKLVNGYILVDSDAEGKEQKKKILGEAGYNKKNTFEINDILKINEKSTLEDLFNKKYLLEAVEELYGGLLIDIDEASPLIEQVKKRLQENKKRYKDKEKEELKKLFFKKITKLKKEDLIREKYYTFFTKFKDRLY